jgi:hypothetical protein
MVVRKVKGNASFFFDASFHTFSFIGFYSKHLRASFFYGVPVIFLRVFFTYRLCPFSFLRFPGSPYSLFPAPNVSREATHVYFHAMDV